MKSSVTFPEYERLLLLKQRADALSAEIGGFILEVYSILGVDGNDSDYPWAHDLILNSKNQTVASWLDRHGVTRDF